MLVSSCPCVVQRITRLEGVRKKKKWFMKCPLLNKWQTDLEVTWSPTHTRRHKPLPESKMKWWRHIFVLWDLKLQFGGSAEGGKKGEEARRFWCVGVQAMSMNCEWASVWAEHLHNNFAGREIQFAETIREELFFLLSFSSWGYAVVLFTFKDENSLLWLWVTH